MSAAGKLTADIGAALMAAAALVISSLQTATPVLASLTTLMAFLWWVRKLTKAALRRWRRWREIKHVDL